SGPAARLNHLGAVAPAPSGSGGGPSSSGPARSAEASGATAAGPGPAAGVSSSGGGAPLPDRPGPLPGGGTTIGLTKGTITLGLFYSRTGPYAGILRNAPAIAQAAADEAGLINGRRLILKYYDDGTANASTIQVEEKRAKDEVFSYVSIMSESNVVLAPLADQHKIPAVIGNIDQKVAESL